MATDVIVKMWVGFDPQSNDPSRVALAKQVFDTTIWPSQYQSLWDNLIISYNTPDEIRQKLNTEFDTKRKIWNVDPIIHNPNTTVDGPFPTQSWRVGKGGLHELVANSITYTAFGAPMPDTWTFKYGASLQYTAFVNMGATWAIAQKL